MKSFPCNRIADDSAKLIELAISFKKKKLKQMFFYMSREKFVF